MTMIEDLTPWTALLAVCLTGLFATARQALQLPRTHKPAVREDAGYTTESVVVTALLAAAAIAVLAIIVAKVKARAQGITL